MTKKADRPRLCKDCQNYDVFKNKCWFFWDEKRECANHSEGFRSLRESFEIDNLGY